jgi:hypothetical protein
MSESISLNVSLRGLLTFLIPAFGVWMQRALTSALPATGLGRILSVPFGVTFSVVVAVAFWFWTRRTRSRISVALLFAATLGVVGLQAIAGHPQDGEAITLQVLWEAIISP